MASYPVIRPIDLLMNAAGMLLPNQVNALTGNTTSSGWTSSLTTSPWLALYGDLPTGWQKPIAVRSASGVTRPCFGINTRCLSGGAYSYACIPLSADSGTYTYSALPYQKEYYIKIYEEIGGSCNFEYFYFRYKGTNIIGKTWSSISNSWTGTITMNLNSISANTDGVFVIHCGGMNTARRVHYSDNVVSPGAWTYIGKYSSLDIQPGINVAYKSYIASGVTRQFPPGSDSIKTGYYMNFAEYAYRLTNVAIGIGFASSPSASNAASSSYYPTFYYMQTCSRYSCSCDCDFQVCIDYTK